MAAAKGSKAGWGKPHPKIRAPKPGNIKRKKLCLIPDGLISLFRKKRKVRAETE